MPVWLIGQLPSIFAANVLLGGLGLLLVVLAFGFLATEGTIGDALLGVVLLGGALLPCVLGELVVMSELWSGVLMALSAVWFGPKRDKSAVVAGIAALFFRELVAPYCVLCVLLAAGGRRYRELALWAAGLAAYAVYFGCTWPRSCRGSAPRDLAHSSGWLRFGGAGFLISTVQMNAYLLLLPQWVTALYLAASLLACGRMEHAGRTRVALTIAGYAVAFSIVGHDFNQYWGSLTAPLFCLAAARARRAAPLVESGRQRDPTLGESSTLAAG